MRWCGYVKQLEWGASFKKGEKEGRGEGEEGEKDTTERGTEREEEGAGEEK